MKYLLLSLCLQTAAIQNEKNVVETYSKPLIRYKENEVILDLDEVPQELKEGLVGLKEGEVRILSIQNELVEVEVIKADATFETHAATAREDSIPKNWF